MYKAIKRIFLYCLLGLILPLNLLAQQISVLAQTDTNSIRIGEQIKLQLTATLTPAQFNDASFKIAFPVVPDSLDHFEVVSRSAVDTAQDIGKHLLHQTITITSFDSGHWQLPPMRFDVVGSGGVPDSAFTEPIGIDVNTVAVDTTKAFKPIKTVQAVPWSLLDYWLYIAIGAALVLIAFGIWWFFVKRKKKEVPKVIGPTISPYELAVQSLKTLKEEKVWQQGDIKQYYTRLTDILRTYFEHQFGIAALEQTSEELLVNIRPVTQLNQQRDKLRSLLAIADLAKFAKMQPTADEHEDCMHKAEEILEWTRPKDEPTEQGPKSENP